MLKFRHGVCVYNMMYMYMCGCECVLLNVFLYVVSVYVSRYVRAYLISNRSLLLKLSTVSNEMARIATATKWGKMKKKFIDGETTPVWCTGGDIEGGVKCHLRKPGEETRVARSSEGGQCGAAGGDTLCGYLSSMWSVCVAILPILAEGALIKPLVLV